MAANLLPKDGVAVFYPQLFSPADALALFHQLQTKISWKQEPIILFGKKIMQPRLTAWFSDDGLAYTYSGIQMSPNPWTQDVLAVKHAVETLTGFKFNSALLNYYRDQKDSMGWHRDNEKELGENPPVASVSLGAVRTFQFRHYFEKKLKTEVELTDGSLLMMSGKTQHFWEHGLPKRSAAIGPRINVTFRQILQG